MRISDTVLANFELEVNQLINEETMPMSQKALRKIFKKLEQKYKSELRHSIAEITTFDEVMFETDKIEEKMKQI